MLTFDKIGRGGISAALSGLYLPVIEHGRAVCLQRVQPLDLVLEIDGDRLGWSLCVRIIDGPGAGRVVTLPEGSFIV